MIDPGILKYAIEHTTVVDDLFTELERQTNLRTLYPRMLSGPYQGKFLEMISFLIKPKHILEIGTFTGYSTICLSRGLDEGGKVTTIEANAEYAAIAADFFTRAGIAGKVELVIGDALEVIPELNQSYDLVYIDAAKEQYSKYYELVFPLVKQGGFILADNVLWDGKVVDPDHSAEKETGGIVQFNEHVMSDDRVETILLTIRDGLMLTRKK